MKKIVSCTLFLVVLVAFTSCGDNGEYYELYEQEHVVDAEPTPSLTPQVVATPQPFIDTNDEIPFMWLVTAPSGQTMYIFGSIHATTADLYPLSSVVMDAFHRSDYLALEIWGSSTPTFTDLLTYADGRTITDDISYELYKSAVAIFVELEMPYDTLDSFMPPVWHSMLAGVAVEKSSLSTEYGLEVFFALEAQRDGMDILSIECIIELSELFSSMSTLLQEGLIEKYLDVNRVANLYNRIYRSWRLGDEAGLLELRLEYLEMLGDDALVAEYTATILTQRDIQMTDRAEQFMSEEIKVFFVVGAFHVIGENSVIDLLIQRGYVVERIR